ncbi:MAG: hypothetical protein JW802_09280 [Campylobacterales bacterium]|nr:hypothetical protein [Campylobacterales bacterium]
MNYSELFENLFTGLGNFLVGLAAIMALFTWKKELQYKKRYEMAEILENCFKAYIHYLHDYYYIVLEKLRENKQALCECELNLKERTLLDKKYLAYLYAWEEMEYYLTNKEINDFTYRPEFLQSELLKMLPIKSGDINEDGFYKLNLDSNFYTKMIDIRKNGLFQIKNFREK